MMKSILKIINPVTRDGERAQLSQYFDAVKVSGSGRERPGGVTGGSFPN